LLVLAGLVILALLIFAVSRKKFAASGVRVPQMEIQDQVTVLVVELPGVSQDEIHIEVEDDVVFVETRGERRYARTELLLEPVDAATLRTEYKNGLLTIRLAKTDCDAQALPRPAAAAGA
jgi:HSP20 family protein